MNGHLLAARRGRHDRPEQRLAADPEHRRPDVEADLVDHPG